MLTTETLGKSKEREELYKMNSVFSITPKKLCYFNKIFFCTFSKDFSETFHLRFNALGIMQGNNADNNKTTAKRKIENPSQLAAIGNTEDINK